MHLHRYLKEENIDLSFTPFPSGEEPSLQPREEGLGEGVCRRQKERVLKALISLLMPSGKICNPNKCLTDLSNREAKASTALGLGIAIPHVRTPQARDFALGVAIVPAPGLWFDAVDEAPVRLFLPMVAPAYNDRFYRKVERALALAVLDEDRQGSLLDEFLQAESAGEVILLLRKVIEVL